ncbi:MAG: Globin [Burkholderia sp.]|jgi:hemoglobin
MTKAETKNFYERIGGEEGIHALVLVYLKNLKTMPEVAHVRALYPEDLTKYETRMTEFLSGFLGGPALYTERHGMPMLRENHRHFPIDETVRDEWMVCMRDALNKCVKDDELRLYLEGVFWKMADSFRSK